MRAQSKLFFVRITAHPWWDSARFTDDLRDAFDLVEPDFVTYRRRRWLPCDFKETREGRWSFQLAKLKDDVQQSKLETDETGHRRLTSMMEEVVPHVRCLFEPKHKLLMAETNNEVSVAALMAVVRKSIELVRRKRGAEVGEVGLAALKSGHGFNEWVQSVDRIAELSFSLKPSNPHSDELWEELDQFIKGTQADRLNLKLKAKQDTLDPEAKLVKMALGQTREGYGNATGVGFAGDVPVSWSTSQDHVIHKAVDKIEDPNEAETVWAKMARAAEREASGHADA